MIKKVLHYDAFSNIPDKGNPAGVVLDANDLSETQMQQIAAKVGFNETAFVLRSRDADHRLRFFTPGHEMPLCGHATIASTLAIIEHHMGSIDDAVFSFETLAGTIDVHYQRHTGVTDPAITMKQNGAQFSEYTDNVEALANVLGIATDEIHPSLPIVYGSTGTWTLIVPVVSLNVIQQMQPDNKRFPEVLTQMPRASIHPFTFETIHADAHMHGRHFSSPCSGTIEDPVTGTASGVMGAYVASYVPQFDVANNTVFDIEQGSETGRDGRVRVELLTDREPWLVQISGSAVFVGEITYP